VYKRLPLAVLSFCILQPELAGFVYRNRKQQQQNLYLGQYGSVHHYEVSSLRQQQRSTQNLNCIKFIILE
jgi:hypothetical protein